MNLIKKYRLLYKDNQIINQDYLNEQTGTTYPAPDVQTFETDLLIELQQFINDNNLELLQSFDF